MASPPGGVSMPPSSSTHQTVELRRGRHRSPEEGACVVELASMLAGERFSDHPRTVCPVIASYMRTLNDMLSDEMRQCLYRYAAEIVDTRGSRRLRRARIRACATWCRQMGAISALREETSRVWSSSRSLGSLCAKSALELDADDPSLALDLVDQLIALGRSGPGSNRSALSRDSGELAFDRAIAP